MNNPTHRVALVTGASEGIGRALAHALVKRDDYQALVITARAQDRLDSLADELRAAGADVLVVPADLTDAAAACGVVDAALAHYGRLDAVFNNAGATMWSKFTDIDDLDIFRKVMDINYFGVLYVTHAALPALRASGGRLVAVASIAGLTGVPTRTGYSASKHAVIGLYDSLRVELRGSGVSVTVVAPDFVVSEIHKRALTGDGTALGKSPMNESKIMTAEACAHRIARAAERRKRLDITSFRGRAGRVIRVLFPGLIDRLAERAIASGH